MAKLKLTYEESQRLFYERFKDKVHFKFVEELKPPHVLVHDGIGICKIQKTHLLSGWNPSIRTALNKNEYFITQAKRIHGNKYDYSKVDYTGTDNKIKIICPEHGEFLQSPHSHLFQKAGCIKCSHLRMKEISGEKTTGWDYNKWFKSAKTSKNFDGFKVYIIRCWNETEEFYKIGRTYKTLKGRFPKHRMPYNYEIVKIITKGEITLNNAKIIYNLENELKNKNKDFKYKPLKYMRGEYECFKQLNL